MYISVLVDSTNSWFCEYAEKLVKAFLDEGHKVEYAHNSKDLVGGDICFLLSCVKLVRSSVLAKFKHNIVIHASDLPKGKGFTPVKWQILEGKNQIPITLFEAVEAMDAGDYYFKDAINLTGYELLDEIHSLLGKKVCEMALRYVKEYNNWIPIKQEGEETIYKKRTIEDDELDITKTIESQFNHFRIEDNERFPLWFRIGNHKYILTISRWVDNQ